MMSKYSLMQKEIRFINKKLPEKVILTGVKGLQ